MLGQQIKVGSETSEKRVVPGCQLPQVGLRQQWTEQSLFVKGNAREASVSHEGQRGWETTV